LTKTFFADNGVCKGCKRKDSTVFLHTVDDRTQFIADFLKELSIKRYDQNMNIIIISMIIFGFVESGHKH